MWALITEAALGYSLSIPSWVYGLAVLGILCSIPSMLRIFRSFFDND